MTANWIIRQINEINSMGLTLKRIASLDAGTFGVLLADGVPFALTLERPWRDNRVGESCIPAGVYLAARCRTLAHYGYADSPKFGDTFEVTDVPGRSLILFHKGNLADDTQGCILVGEQFEMVNGQPGVAASAKGFTEFLALTQGVDRFAMTITEDKRG